MMIEWLIYWLEFPVDDGSLIGSSILQWCLLVFVFNNEMLYVCCVKKNQMWSVFCQYFMLQSQRYLDTQDEITEAPKILCSHGKKNLEIRQRRIKFWSHTKVESSHFKCYVFIYFEFEWGFYSLIGTKIGSGPARGKYPNKLVVVLFVMMSPQRMMSL